jgi:hypothetical protein
MRPVAATPCGETPMTRTREVSEHDETTLLSVIETLIKRLCCLG